MSEHTKRQIPVIVEQLATTVGRRDEGPNMALAERVASTLDKDAVSALIRVSLEGTAALRADAIKVLYEAGEQAPDLLVPHLGAFVDLLDDRNNRLVWGAMCAIDVIARVAPAKVYAQLAPIMAAVDKGSVITRDHGVRVLVELGGDQRFATKAWPLLLEVLRTCPVNQIPMYAESTGKVVPGRFEKALIGVLEDRLMNMAQPAKRVRINKVLKRLTRRH